MIRTSVLSLLQCNFVDPLQRNPRSLVTHLGWTLENQQHHLPFKINQERNFIISSKKHKLFPDFFFCCILIFLFVKFAVRRPGLAAVQCAPAGCLCLARRRIRSCPARLQAVAIISIHSHSPSSARELVSAKQFRGWHVKSSDQTIMWHPWQTQTQEENIWSSDNHLINYIKTNLKRFIGPWYNLAFCEKYHKLRSFSKSIYLLKYLVLPPVSERWHHSHIQPHVRAQDPGFLADLQCLTEASL